VSEGSEVKVTGEKEGCEGRVIWELNEVGRERVVDRGDRSEKNRAADNNSAKASSVHQRYTKASTDFA